MNLEDLEPDKGQPTQAEDLGMNHPAQTHHNVVIKPHRKIQR
jgi:hypothetical protein